MAAEQAWYITERAEALATLFLTRRNDLEVIPSGRYGQESGYHILVRIKMEHASTDTTFGIQVKGVRSEKRRGKSSFPVTYARSQLRDTGLPICVFLFAVDDEQGYYRWLLESVISPTGKAKLRFGLAITHDNLERRERVLVRSIFEPLNNLTGQALDALTEQVKRWYMVKGSPYPIRP